MAESECNCCGAAAGSNADCPVCSRQMCGNRNGEAADAHDSVSNRHTPARGQRSQEAVFFGENGEREMDSEDWMVWFCREHALSQESAMEILADVANHWSDHATEAMTVRAEVLKAKELIERGFVQLQNYEKQNGDRQMAERCLWLLLDFPMLAGADTLAALVKLIGRKKATINKCLQFFQSQMPELPILPGQRDIEARKNMSAEQKKIWHEKHNSKPRNNRP